MKVAVAPGTVHALKSMMWWWLDAESSVLTASPIWSEAAGMTVVMSFWFGANSAVVRPGAGRPQAQETRPEQSER
jgi:hypothetical protein